MANTNPGAAAKLADTPEEQPDRKAAPVDGEQPPRLPFPVVGIGASAGGLEAITEFLTQVREDSGMAYVFVQHLPPASESMLVEILAKRTTLPVEHVNEGQEILPNRLYVIRPGHTLTMSNGVFRMGERLARPMHNRPVDDFFRSLAEEQRERAIAVILAGMGSNGTAGAQAVKAVGGLCVAQDPETTNYPSMPRHLIDSGYADYILRPQDMPGVLLAYAGRPYAKGEREDRAALAKREQQYVREILAVLRTRTHQDFNGYKKATVLRRIQRRMGLNRIIRLGEYAKFLRQTQTEVSALSDDLLIHVTGFFRDAAAWEILRQRVILPLVAARHNDESIRCWVAACSTGEEAYTLAILLVEEMERANKILDIKIFATDMADRSLQNARAGVYPGGIESELTPERLERFFQRDDSIYRVRPELRERVIFAPQNILQDPPFSRLDIVTCRNLLIYLEPEMQSRIVDLLHFGLREGGALFLGTSETVTSDELFEAVDKQAKIFRRIGRTRHGTADFPIARAFGPKDAERYTFLPRAPMTRPSMAQMITRSLMEHHTPAAITIDREHRIVYFHGNTEPYIALPRGEPTRDVLDVIRESLRGAVRTAVQRASSGQVASQDAWIENADGTRVRVVVTVSPLDPRNSPDHLVVSFQQRPDLPENPEQVALHGGRDPLELRRAREELQRTIEELQASNEELKASHEEVVSMNEELQSTNEELETSREEMQSLNEELSTVNTQLQGKIEEHQAARNDLASLLASTDIAVLFLDRQFRIRRYTAAVRELMDVIGTDIGRPMFDLAKKFDDPDLNADVENVLVQLIPVEREIIASNGRTYMRRVLPYRTHDNHIDGVVVTFVDISDRAASELALRQSEEQLRLLVEGARDFAMFMLNEQGLISRWNVGAERVLGYSEAEVMGKSSELIFTPEDRAAEVPAREMTLAATAGRVAEEHWYLRKNGERFWGAGVLTTLRHPDGSLQGYVKVMQDDTMRKKAEEALQASKEAAESANRMKDAFLTTLSHELRTPLSAILLWTEALQERPATEEDLKEGLRAIKESAEAQRELIEDLLDLSRITRGTLRLKLRDVLLLPVVQDAVEAVRAAAVAKGLTLDTDLSAEAGVVHIDPDRVRQIVSNLLTNALKFTPAGGRIKVALKRVADAVEIRVSDTGQGISAQFMPRVFEQFQQADSSHSRAQGGMGLGLSISRQLVELHGGTIVAESAGEGRGAAFIVRLPLGGPQALAAVGHAPPAVSRDASGRGLKGVGVLLVEDNDATRRALVKLLRDWDVEVHEESSAAGAIKRFEEQRPDMLISDLGLPGTDGYTMMRQMREKERARSATPVPAIALTAFADGRSRTMALEAGFNRHLGKPVDTMQLITAMRELARDR